MQVDGEYFWCCCVFFVEYVEGVFQVLEELFVIVEVLYLGEVYVVGVQGIGNYQVWFFCGVGWVLVGQVVVVGVGVIEEVVFFYYQVLGVWVGVFGVLVYWVLVGEFGEDVDGFEYVFVFLGFVYVLVVDLVVVVVVDFVVVGDYCFDYFRVVLCCYGYGEYGEWYVVLFEQFEQVLDFGVVVVFVE